MYINKNLKKSFIKESYLLSKALILFIKKKNNLLYLCVDYQSLNIVIIKNQYLLLLINKALNQLSRVKIYIKLNIYFTYNLIRI